MKSLPLRHLRALLSLAAVGALAHAALPGHVAAQSTAPVTPTPIAPSVEPASPAPPAPPAPVVSTPPAPAPAAPAPVVTAPPTTATTQHASRLSPPPPPGAPQRYVASPRTADAPVESAREAEGDDESKDPMGWFGLTIKVGVANINAGRIDNPVYNASIAAAAASLPPTTLEAYGLVGGCTPVEKKCRTPSRTGFHIAATLHLGGDGFGWDVEPYLSTASDALAAGVYTGPKFDIHVADPFYLGFGFGFKAAYVAADGWKYGGDVFGRIPVHATYYLMNDLALTFEGSFGAGISMLVSESRPITDPRNGRMLTSVPKLGIGTARSFDFTVGIRFP